MTRADGVVSCEGLAPSLVAALLHLTRALEITHRKISSGAGKKGGSNKLR